MDKCIVCNGSGFKERLSCSNWHGKGEVVWIDNIIPNGDLDFNWIYNELLEVIEPFKYEPADKQTKSFILSAINKYFNDLVARRIIQNYDCNLDFEVVVRNFGEEVKFKIDIGSMKSIKL